MLLITLWNGMTTFQLQFLGSNIWKQIENHTKVLVKEPAWVRLRGTRQQNELDPVKIRTTMPCWIKSQPLPGISKMHRKKYKNKSSIHIFANLHIFAFQRLPNSRAKAFHLIILNRLFFHAFVLIVLQLVNFKHCWCPSAVSFLNYALYKERLPFVW